MEYNPFSFDLQDDPFPTYRWLRDEAPLYRNEKLDFWAISRFEDCWEAFGDWKTYSSARGTTPGTGNTREFDDPDSVAFLAMDPPKQKNLRNVISRFFTPRKIAELEPGVRALAVRYLKPLVDRHGCDIIADFGAKLPMDVISLMLGIPEEDREMVREWANAIPEAAEERPEASSASVEASLSLAAYFLDQIEQRRARPREDLMSLMLAMEYREENGNVRTLHDHEAVVFAGLLAGAGNDTTTKFLGNAILALADHPDQRRDLVQHPGLAASAMKEILRYDGVSHYQYRYVTRDVEWYGARVPEGSWMVLVQGATGRDERVFEDPDRLDLRRKFDRELAFGRGAHICLGAHLARLEGRIMLEELHARIPEYDVVTDGIVRARTVNLRGLKALPIVY